MRLFCIVYKFDFITQARASTIYLHSAALIGVELDKRERDNELMYEICY